MLVLILFTMTDDEKEFLQRLYIDYKPLVMKKIRDIVGNDSELEDLTNLTFLKLVKKLSLLKNLGLHKRISYIGLTSKRVAINFIKHRDIHILNIIWKCRIQKLQRKSVFNQKVSGHI